MRNRLLPLAACAVFGLAFAAPAALAQSKTTMHFERGNDNAAATGTVKGNGYADYILGAKKGQTLSVAISVDKTDGNGTIYFNILPPGSTGEAIFNGSMDGDFGSVTLPKSGDYTVRVYLMGNDADTGKTVGYTLSVTIM